MMSEYPVLSSANKQPQTQPSALRVGGLIIQVTRMKTHHSFIQKIKLKDNGFKL